jgi:hypothetical protein
VWMDLEEDVRQEAREHIMALSRDKRTFLVDPPKGTDFQFEDAMLPSAMATLRADDELQRKRFELVPGKVNEKVRHAQRLYLHW